LHRNDYYSDFRYLSPEESLTCVIGAKCKDGCAIISDARETTGTQNRDVNKIRVLWNDKGAMAGAGDVPVISKVAKCCVSLRLIGV
jgi:20S proteasome alpha/beta subunit